jgi:hypothetical protein
LQRQFRRYFLEIYVDNKFGLTRLLTRFEAARFLGVAPNTLAVWACTNRYSLPFVKVGRKVMYRLSDLEAFILVRMVGLGVTA